MIVKQLSRKNSSYGGLLKYLVRGNAVLKLGTEPFLIRHNVFGKDLQQIEAEFLENEKSRKLKRSNNVKLFHTIISFGKDDTPNLNKEKIERLVREYIALSNSNVQSVWAIHMDTSSVHAHGMTSGVELFTGRANRISKHEFALAKEKLQDKQIELYPELSSIVQHGKKVGRTKSEREFQLERRTGKESDKATLKQKLEEIYKRSNSKAAFFDMIRKEGLSTYERGGKVAGIVGEKNMRFKTMGFDETKLKELDKKEDRLSRLREARGEDKALDNYREKSQAAEKLNVVIAGKDKNTDALGKSIDNYLEI